VWLFNFSVSQTLIGRSGHVSRTIHKKTIARVQGSGSAYSARIQEATNSLPALKPWQHLPIAFRPLQISWSTKQAMRSKLVR